MKTCAVVRTERIATRGGRSSGQVTPRRTTNLDPKGRGDKSMFVKRGTAEGVYAVAPQRLSDMAKAGLPESQSPVVERTLVGNTPVTGAIGSHGFGFRSWYALSDGRCTASAFKGMSGEPTSL